MTELDILVYSSEERRLKGCRVGEEIRQITRKMRKAKVRGVGGK